jgi:hypothetical protein
VQSDVPPHEKIRFRRSDLTRLDSLPSAVGEVPVPRRRSVRRALLVWTGSLAGVLVAVGMLGYVAILAGVGQERMRQEAEKAVTALFGDSYDVDIGGIGLAIDASAQLAVEVRDATVAATASGQQVMRVDSLQFGLRLWPLVRGEARFGATNLAGARIVLAAIPRDERGASPIFMDEHGRLDPDALLDALFDGASRAVGALDRLDVERISLTEVELAANETSSTTVSVSRADLTETDDGSLAVDADLDYGGIPATVRSTFAATGSEATATDAITLVVDIAPSETGAPHGFGRHTLGSARLSIDGKRYQQEESLAITGMADDLDLHLGNDDRFSSDVSFAGAVRRGDHKLEIERMVVASGRSSWRFHGAVGPVPVIGDTDALPGYRFELVSDGSTLAPAGSTEPALPLVARLAGTLTTDASRIDVAQIGVRTGLGEITGSAAVSLASGLAPGLELALDISSMPVGQVKQIWPWFAARGARNWVVANIFGGRVEQGTLQVGVPPGRMGNGVPFGADEVSGSFTVSDTRFDIAGRIPPVRDGYGAVEFAGTDVDVALHSGTVFMPDGRTVDASNGQLTIRAAHVSPVIGKLALDVQGDADAVMALASYEPIDVGRYIDVKPDELEGTVEGVVHADIPLQANIPAETLDWQVDLAYQDLTLARPFEGQVVSEANGTIKVDPTRAAIDATAKLNGAAATIHMVEPLGDGGVARERRISLELDDRAREALAPGLSMLLAGPTVVELDDAVADRRTFKASLNRSTLTIPWAGWSKGPGVPGDVEFTMSTDGNRVELADFALSGETFSARGNISLVDGAVTRVRFPSAKLNRNDDFSVDLAARGNGYAITIRGTSIDARSVIKLYSQDSAAAAEGTSSSVPISVDLAVDAMTGFHGEVLRDVTMAYSGTGARTDRLEFTAVTRNGTPVTFKDGRDGEARSVTMQSSDAGSVLRFLDIYEHMEGGALALALSGSGDGPLRGQADARNFWVVNEPRLKSLVSSTPSNDGRSLNQAVRGDIDTTRVQFERGFSQIEKGTGYLKLAQGVLRGPLIGSTFQGTFYDAQGNMDMTGTFMPAYGLNRIFGEIPLVGAILGNGRDRGLIGITFRLAGDAGEPQLQVNPLSVIAPGIFRSVFEFR